MGKLTEKWKLSKAGKALVIGLASLVVLLLLFSFLPVVKASYQAEESYTEVETYYARGTETVIESHTETEVYCDEPPCQQYIPFDYQVVSAEGYNAIGYDGQPECNIEIYIKNLDEIGGDFFIDFVLFIQHNLTTTISDSKYIAAGQTGKIVVAYHEGALENTTSFVYSITAPIKRDTSYREETVTEDVEVTQEVYSPVEVTVLKTRTVTAYKWVSLLTYLIDY